MVGIQAPKGGIVSPVNGQWYEGGEFLPDHGHYCGKGRNRVTQEKFAEVWNRAQTRGLSLVYDERFDDYRLLTQPYGLVQLRSKTIGNLVKHLDWLDAFDAKKARRESEAYRLNCNY